MSLPRVNWIQACVEAFLLLVGVLLALMGQAWWEDRDERETVHEYAANLSIEVSANQQQLRKAILNHDGYAKAGVSLIQAMQGEIDSALSLTIKEHLSKLGYISDFRPSTASLRNLVGSGGLGLLESAELQLAVSNYSRLIEDHNVLQVENLKFFHDEYIPFISERASLLDLEFMPASMGLPRDSRFGFEIEVLTESMTFENLIVRRISAEVDAKKFAERLLEAAADLERLLAIEDFG